MCSVLRVFEGPRTQMGLTGKGKQTSDIAMTVCYRYVGGGGGTHQRMHLSPLDQGGDILNMIPIALVAFFTSYSACVFLCLAYFS